ncbi:MAG: GNAT family N-acetyltransferase [Saprospiraceae bacterium]
MSDIAIPFCKKKNEDWNIAYNQVNIVITDTIECIKYPWSNLAGNNAFFSVSYLSALEKNPAEGIVPFYVLIQKDEETIGIAYFQWKNFKLNENIRENGPIDSSIIQKVKRNVINVVNFPALVCGNLLLTGSYGFTFLDNISDKEQWRYLEKTIEELTLYLSSKGKPVGLVLVKDFISSHKKDISSNSFVEFKVQPTMMMDIQNDWSKFEDYKEALKSKYRVRYRKAKKDLEPIDKIEFTAEDIAQHKETIYNLYLNVSNQAEFNSFLLHEHYFESVKESMGDQFTFLTYWKNNKMIGFSSTLQNGDYLHAHFLGYEKEANKHCQLYLNMLYDIVDQAIQHQLTHIDFSRTAIEIKSTVGAKDVPLYLYMKHMNPLWHNLIKPILKLVAPKTDHTIRHPFKDELDH